ncbi:hypothetical protein ElyMa_006049600 [Elysia marginata]|uniref:Uncharacterized protein n=1 Tax=Elysia marginata TaxID=1093978 RepID=A0AAV4GPL6_9GAST|nr:hypothetical protein ElyMa_006049600 [Elysia marginata]
MPNEGRRIPGGYGRCLHSGTKSTHELIRSRASESPLNATQPVATGYGEIKSIDGTFWWRFKVLGLRTCRRRQIKSTLTTRTVPYWKTPWFLPLIFELLKTL